MNALSQYAFSSNSFGVQSNLYPYLQSQRRGFNFFSSTEDPKINERVLNYQSTLLMHLTNATVLRRLTNSRMYGNGYTAMAMLTDLTNAIFKGDNGLVPTFRFNLQDAYTDRLLTIVNSNNFDAISQAAALAQLKSIEKMPAGASDEAKAHANLLIQKIKKGLEK
jgi:hypothetical protein